jgi:hypothetical protein
MRRITLLIALAAATLAAAGPAAAQQPAAEPIAPLGKETPIREYAGYVLFSRWDGTAYHLSVLRDGAVNDVPVRPQATPFDADIGPSSGGGPSAVVSLCDASCDLYVFRLGADEAPRPVTNANTGADETDPSIWRGRIVFAREYGEKVVPYTKLLTAPRSHPSDRLAALPAERCGAVDPPSCRPIVKAELAGMELWGRWVGQSWTYQPDGFPGFRQNEIRLTDVARTDTRQIAAMVTGLSGQTYLGPSFASGRLAFFRACQGDPSGCSASNSGAFRYAISGRTYEIAGANEAWAAWALTGTGDLHVPGSFDCSGGDRAAPPSEACAIWRRGALDWGSVPAERVR